MERRRAGRRNKGLAFLFLIGVAVFGAWSYQKYFLKRQALPRLDFKDVNAEQSAGQVDQVIGTSRLIAGQGASPEAAARDGAPYFLGTSFRVSAQSQLQLRTSGNWIVVLDGDGEFVLSDARTNELRSVHSTTWIVKKGTFRAKPHDFDKTDHWLEVSTENARIVVQQGELGLTIPVGGGGRFWLVSGKATVFWNNGKTQTLESKGMGYL